MSDREKCGRQAAVTDPRTEKPLGELARTEDQRAQNYDPRVHGERRKGERRQGERRGLLRWDPKRRERRSGMDRRKPPPPD